MVMLPVAVQVPVVGAVDLGRGQCLEICPNPSADENAAISQKRRIVVVSRGGHGADGCPGARGRVVQLGRSAASPGDQHLAVLQEPGGVLAAKEGHGAR